MITKSISGVGISALLVCVGLSAACTETPAKAPNSDPRDMTAAGHREAAHEEEQLAEGYEMQKENVGPSKPDIEENQKAVEEHKAERHRDYARQQNEAADIIDESSR